MRSLWPWLVLLTMTVAFADEVDWFADEWTAEPEFNGLLDDVDLIGEYLEVRVDLDVLNNEEVLESEELEPIPDDVDDFPSQKEVDAILNAVEPQARIQLSTLMAAEFEEISVHAADFLDDKRLSLLEQAKDEAFEAMMDHYRKKAGVEILQLDAAVREGYSKGQSYIAYQKDDEGYDPDKSKVWQTALKEILTETEREQIVQGVADQRQRRTRALASIITAEIDYWVGFDRAQREKIIALANEPLLELPEADFFRLAPVENYTQLQLHQAMQLLQKSEPIKGVLDEAQWKRFEAVTAEQLSPNTYYSRSADFSIEDWPMPEVITDVDAERMISHVIWKASNKQMLSQLTEMEAQREHVCRIVKPSEDQAQQLQTATKGAAEELAVSWLQNIDQNVRRRLRGVEPSQVPKQLKNVSLPSYSNYRNANQAATLWEKALKTVLSEDQRKQLQEAKEASETWKDEAVLMLLMSDVDMVARLSADRREALQTKLGEIMKEYKEEFNNMFSPGWYLTSYYSGIVVAMLTEEERADYFGKERAKLVESRLVGQAREYSENLRQQHKEQQGNRNPAKGLLQMIFR